MKTFDEIYGFSFGEKPGNINRKWPLGERVRVHTPAKVLEQCGIFCSGDMGRIMDGTMMVQVFKADTDEVLYETEDFMTCNIAPAPLDGSEVPEGLPWKLDGQIAQEAPGSMFIGPHWLEPDADYDFLVYRKEGHKPEETRMMTYRCPRNRGNYPDLVPLPEVPEGPVDDTQEGVPMEFGGRKYLAYPQD